MDKILLVGNSILIHSILLRLREGVVTHISQREDFERLNPVELPRDYNLMVLDSRDSLSTLPIVVDIALVLPTVIMGKNKRPEPPHFLFYFAHIDGLMKFIEEYYRNIHSNFDNLSDFQRGILGHE